MKGRDNEEDRGALSLRAKGNGTTTQMQEKVRKKNLRGKIENGKKTRRKIRRKGKGGYIKAQRRPRGKVNGRGDRRP